MNGNSILALETKAEEIRERNMFGDTLENTKIIVDRSFKFYYGLTHAKAMVITSYLSDVQELVERGCSEDARQLINVVKWIVNNYDETGKFIEK